MEKKKAASGTEFYLAASVQDFLDHSGSLEQDAVVVLTNVSLQVLSNEESSDLVGGAGYWYKVFDHMTETLMYWPLVYWQTEESGLTPEMRECGFFVAPVLEIHWSQTLGPRIVRILGRKEPDRARDGVRGWLGRICPALS